jgi:superfamily II DNA or RNA helicase
MEENDGEGNAIVPGLRPPQIGALHAIGAHWSLEHEPATIVMPTGTGKTETMLAALVALVRGPLLVVVPSDALRHQTVRKFETLGLLRELGVIPADAPNPIVGIIDRRPRNVDDLDIFDRCNVIVSTLSAIGQGTAVELGARIASKVTTLIVDEAHHIAAGTWSTFREHFNKRRVLQFTATPYRRDGQLVDGRVIYSYPLHRAQADGYFKPIDFKPIYEFDEASADRAIAETAIGQLKEDLTDGWNHAIMARCDSIARAEEVHAIYTELAPEYEPALVHSDTAHAGDIVDKVRRGESRIVVCVNMLGEGFDLPRLKIAAIHDTHKSLAVLLQFTGRFTRSAGNDIGNATVIANINHDDVHAALERLYSEDADWNQLLSEYSSNAVREHTELVDFLRESVRLGEDRDNESIPISHSLLRPKFSAGVFRCRNFRPRRFHEALGRHVQVHAAWLHEESNTLYFVTRTEPPVTWTRSKQLRDLQWDLFVLHYDAAQQLLYIHSSDKSTMHEKLATAVGDGDSQLVWGDTVFRVLGRITRLVFQQVGVRKIGRRNLRCQIHRRRCQASVIRSADDWLGEI